VSCWGAVCDGYTFSAENVREVSLPRAAATLKSGKKTRYYKTKMCKFHATGMCARDSLCPFAHSSEESNPLPDLFRTQLCPALKAGVICAVNNCKYAHSHNELQKTGKTPKTTHLQQKQELKWKQQQGQEQEEQQPEHKQKQECEKEQDHEQEHKQKQRSEENQSEKHIQHAQHAKVAAVISLNESLGALCASIPSEIENSDAGAVQTNVNMNPWTTQACDAQKPKRLSSSCMVKPDAVPFTCVSMSSAPVQGSAEHIRVRTQTVEQNAKKNGRRRSTFYKTRWCKDILTGTCKSGLSCKFAHSIEELNPRPDLFHTKMCRVLIETGTCTNQKCTFAHHEHELRDLSSGQDVRIRCDVNLLSNRHDHMTFMGLHQMCSSLSVLIGEQMLVVKNTFLHVQERSLCPARLRSHSMPSLKSMSLLA